MTRHEKYGLQRKGGDDLSLFDGDDMPSDTHGFRERSEKVRDAFFTAASNGKCFCGVCGTKATADNADNFLVLAEVRVNKYAQAYCFECAVGIVSMLYGAVTDAHKRRIVRTIIKSDRRSEQAIDDAISGELAAVFTTINPSAVLD